MDPEVNSETASSGFKFLLLEIGIAGVIILAALFLLNYFSILSLSSLSPSLFSSLPQKSQTTNTPSVLFPSPGVDSENTILIPVAKNNPNVVSSAILYNLKGKIANLETQNNVTTLTLEQKDPVIPPVSLLGNTSVKIQKQSGSEITVDTGKIADLKTGQEIGLTVIYDPTTGSWKGYNLIIVKSSQ